VPPAEADREILANDPRQVRVVPPGSRRDVCVAVEVADAVALAVKVALGTPVTEAVAEKTGDGVVEAVAVALGTVDAVAVNVDVIVGIGVTVASSTMIVPAIPADAAEV
jgi:hypothetical protein